MLNAWGCCAEVKELVGQVDSKWGTVMESIEDIRVCLSDALLEMGNTSDREGDLEQFERLILLGESACAPHTISHFLSSKIGEFGLRGCHFQKFWEKAEEGGWGGCQ